MKAVISSLVNQQQVERFLSNYPIVKELIESGLELYQVMEKSKEFGFPFTGLLQCCFQFLKGGEPLERIDTGYFTLLVYVERNPLEDSMINSMINCEIRNAKSYLS